MSNLDQTITYRAIQERAKDCAREAMPEFPKMPERQIYADSARGIYIPQHFAESVNRECIVEGASAEDLDTLAMGPGACEFYWETWEDVLDSCVLQDGDGQRWILHQDGDLFLVPENFYQNWEAFLDDVEAIDAWEVAHESSEWDWVIYFARALELCQAVPSSVLHDAESQWHDMSGPDGITENFGLYEFACELAAHIVTAEIVDAVETVKEELIDLAQSQLDNM